MSGIFALLELVGEGLDANLPLQVGRRGLGVVGGERLVRPAIGEQGSVEPDVRRLVQDDEVVGVVRDLDVAGGRIEQPGVPAGRTADRLLDGQRLLEGRPGEADPVGQDGQPGREQTGHALGPRRVVLPGADVDLDRRAQDVGAHRGVAVRAWAVGDEVGEELERPVERAAAEDRAAGPVGGGRGDLARLDLDVEALGEDHSDRAARRAGRRERPHRERDQRVADPQVARRGATRVGHVELQPVLRGLAAEQASREVESEPGVGLGLGDGPDRGRVAARGQLQGRRPRQDVEEGVVEVEPAGRRVLQPVVQRQVDRDVHPSLVGLDVVAS